MASTSIQKKFKYDVFLSFRGEDTRKNFVDHLYHALQQRNINTYKDDEKIEKGERISEQLIASIEDSRYYIIVFSKKYASSSWCLDELVHIMECQKMMEHTAYPIFYDVEPTEVRNQSGLVGLAFAKHKKASWRLFGDQQKEKDVERWTKALKEAAGLAGMELKNTVDGHEAKFIQKIVKHISLKLRLTNVSVNGKLVGMETRVKDVVSYLETSFDDVQMIGINGMGGSGKTTLARVVFDQMSIWFEGKSFVENVREVSNEYDLCKLQKQILQDVLNDKSIDVNSVYDGKNMMKKMMPSRMVLVVLDDVDDIDQLEALAGSLNWFKPGSKIIITTRDKQVLVAHGIHSDNIHDIKLLSNVEAVFLFSRYAFGKEIPDKGYEELLERVVRYADGLPLTIKILASSLCGGTKSEWGDAIKILKSVPLKENLEKLELSYNSLENDHKEIFLDVACILKGERKEEAIRILESCGFQAEFGLKVLERKSLITISDIDGLRLHDRIEEMAKNIVRRVGEPNRHNRLWITEEIENILRNDLGTEATQSIKLKSCDIPPIAIMNGLRKMKGLRFLYMDGGCLEWVHDQVGQYLPNTLRSLYWIGYPFLCLPQTFKAIMLVNLEMPHSSISQLWEGNERKALKKLRFLNLKHSWLKTFDLGLAPHVERLDLRKCCGFVELKMPVECPNLRLLDLNGSKVSNFNLGLTPNIESLDLGECSDFVELQMPVECLKLKYLNLSNSKLSNFNLGLTPNLEVLDLRGCKDFVELHMPVECPRLQFLYLGSSKLSTFNLELAPCLEFLFLEGCKDFVELHMPVECPKLKYLYLGGSKVNNLNLGLTPHLETLDIKECKNFVELHMPVECPMLKFLYVKGSNLRSLNLGLTPFLEVFEHDRCIDFVDLHMPVECPKLKLLYLTGSKVSSINLGLTPNLEVLDVRGCRDFVELLMPVECPKLKFLYLNDTKLSNLNLELTPHLEFLHLEGCKYFVELHMPVECPKLKFLYLGGSKLRNLNLGLIPNLVTLDIKECKDFVELHMPVECPKLKYLYVKGSKLRNLNFGLTPILEVFEHDRCKDFVELHMPVVCQKLKFLYVTGSKVSSLNLRMTPYLEVFDARGCTDFVELHMPVECPKLRYLYLSGTKLSNLNLGLTPDLETLDLGGCKDFVELYVPVECPKLRHLYLSGSKVRNLNLGLTPNLGLLDLKECYRLQEILAPVGCLKKLVYLNLSGCSRFKYFFIDKPWNSVGLNSIATLELSAESVNNCPLHPNSYLPKFQFKCKYDQELPLSSGNLEKLISFGLCVCTNLESFSASICGLEHIRVLKLEGTIPEVPQDMWQLESLEELTLSMEKIKHLPDSICRLKHLRSMELKSCFLLENLPKDLGKLESLEKLQLSDCISLRDIPISVCKMKCLKYLLLPYCVQVEKLPDELGRLKSLKELNIEGIGINHLPESIFQLEGLCIVWSRGRLESYGFTSFKEVSRFTASCYIKK